MHHVAVHQESAGERLTRRLGLFLLGPLLLLLSLPVVLNLSRQPDFGYSVHRLEVVQIRPLGPAATAGLRPGDRLLAVDGRPLGTMAAFFAAEAGRFDLRPRRLLIERRGQRLTVDLTPTTPPQARLIRGYSLWVAGLAFLLIGWWVLWRRPDPVARNFFALCFIFAFFLLDVPELPDVTYGLVKELLRTLLQFLLPAYFLRFFLQFPTPRHKAPGEPVRYRLLLVPPVLLFTATVLLTGVHPAPAGSSQQVVLETVSVIYMLGCFCGGLLLFARRALRKDRPIQRTKMAVILTGLGAGMVPFLTSTLIGNLDPGSALPQWQYLAFSLLLVPASFGLAIMRYGALDAAFVVRTSLVYGLLTLLLVLAYFVVAVGLGQLIFGLFRIDAYPVLLLIVATSGLAILPLRRLVQSWIDSAFYPARRANRRAMGVLADELTGLIDSEAVIDVLLTRLHHLYRPRRLSLFLREGNAEEGFAARHAAGAGPAVAADGLLPEPDRLDADGSLALLLNRLRRPVYTEEMEDLLLSGDVDSQSLTLLTRLGTALLVPLITGNRLLGFLAFGPKRGGGLYSQEDLANLHALAVQAASLVESRRLYKESLDRRRLETELQVARDIQARLLPLGPLAGPEFLIVGRNEPCRMVGGDYFDYFQRADGTLCFAIADVAGKGIPAALQMTSLRAAFRREAEGSGSPRVVLSALNGAVAEQVGSGTFVCFFFGLWDPRTGLLTYCNAGMDPPVLFRPGSRFRQDLKKGGPVLGVAPDFVYREGALRLHPGDRLFLYTDGLTEEQDQGGAFFEAARLLDLVQANLEAAPHRLLELVFSQVNRFGGQEKVDDRTAILLTING